ncbi:competence type IV pilus minor pilin ComGD [Psychrobacillus sp. L3]|uniref:competence type IV pilus minor pilin ComGD n=1 Tax=Psychrobacillus sp. L3 TaxID=3236891 RepID=UPI0036F28E4F
MVKLNERGFTLIEMLLVLSIVMVMTSSIIFVATSKLEEMEEKRFFKQFQLDVQRLQSIAIGEQKYTYISFKENGSKYIAKSANVELFEYGMPIGVRLSRDSSLKDITFHPNGSVKEFGTLLFDTKKGLKKVTLYIGRGRMNYE